MDHVKYLSKFLKMQGKGITTILNTTPWLLGIFSTECQLSILFNFTAFLSIFDFLVV